MSDFQDLSQAIENFEKTIQSYLDTIDLKSWIFQVIKSHFYTKKVDKFYHAEIFYGNETLSHCVQFSDFQSISVRKFVVNYQFYDKDTKIDVIFSVLTDKNDEFILVLKCNHDLSVYDVEYWVD